MRSIKKIAVIGGGIAGLSCAYELSKKNLDVCVFEKENHVGGRMSSRSPKGLPFDTGAQILGKNYSSAYGYCLELGIADSWEILSERNDYIFRDDQLHLLYRFKPTNLLSKAAFFRMLFSTALFRWSSSGMNLLDLTATQEIYPEKNAYDYAVAIAGKEIVDYVIDPLFYGNNFYGIQHLSVSALLSGFRFAALDVGKYCHIKEKSIGFLPEKLSEKLNVRLSLPIVSVASIGNKVEVTTQQSKELFDAVVLALPTPKMKEILLDPTEIQKDIINKTRYSSTITLSFLVPAHAIDQISMGCVPPAESKIISSFVGQPIKGKGSILNGKGLLNVFLRDPCAKQLMGQSNESIFEFVKPECIRVCPSLKSCENEVENYDLQRWPEAIPLIPPGYISAIDHFWKEGQGHQNIYLCGDFLASPYVEGSIRCGKRVAKAILQEEHP